MIIRGNRITLGEMGCAIIGIAINIKMHSYMYAGIWTVAFTYAMHHYLDSVGHEITLSNIAKEE